MGRCILSNTEIDRGLLNVIASVSEAFPDADPTRQAQLVGVARRVTAARELLANPGRFTPRQASPRIEETDDERIAREDEASARRIDATLSGLCLSPWERRFAEQVGGRIVELVSDLYVQATADGEPHDPACITAAVTVALLTVFDPPETELDTAPGTVETTAD